MRILVTGSAGHLGEALMRTLRHSRHELLGLDLIPSPFTQRVGSIVDREFVRQSLAGIDAVLHTATLHKPHVATHSRQDFIDTNITGTLNLLEEAAAVGVRAFVFTSTTSVYGDALAPDVDADAIWVDEDLPPVPKNIYGVTKHAAEQLCEVCQRNQGLPCVILRTSRFFPEADDDESTRLARADANIKANEFLYRRVDIEDVVSAHLLALECAPALGFGRYVVSATTPFTTDDLPALNRDAASVVQRHVPEYAALYAERGWTLFPRIERVYVNARARADLGWRPRHDFSAVLERLRWSGDLRSPLARAIGTKGYHDTVFSDGPYPVS